MAKAKRGAVPEVQAVASQTDGEQIDLVDAIAGAAPKGDTPDSEPEPTDGRAAIAVTVSADPTITAETQAALGELAKAGADVVARATEAEKETLREAVAATGPDDARVLPDEPKIEVIAPQAVRVTAAGGPRRRAGFGFGPNFRDLTFAEIEAAGQDPEAVIRALMDDPFLSVGPVPPDG